MVPASNVTETFSITTLSSVVEVELIPAAVLFIASCRADTIEINDVLEFKEPLSDVDFKRLATGQNLKPRQNYLAELRRKVKQDATNYQFMHINQLPYFNGNK